MYKEPINRMIMSFENTSLWKNTLGIQGDHSIDRLRISYLSMREHTKGLLDEVRRDFPNLTDHSLEHVDNLWRISSIITGDDYPINPLEGFILGCAFLVHDSVLTLILKRFKLPYTSGTPTNDSSRS